jgi:hypothetical protein
MTSPEYTDYVDQSRKPALLEGWLFGKKMDMYAGFEGRTGDAAEVLNSELGGQVKFGCGTGNGFTSQLENGIYPLRMEQVHAGTLGIRQPVRDQHKHGWNIRTLGCSPEAFQG